MLIYLFKELHVINIVNTKGAVSNESLVVHLDEFYIMITQLIDRFPVLSFGIVGVKGFCDNKFVA